MLFLWAPLFGLPWYGQVQTNPSCIRIIGDIVGDSSINEWIKQEFTHVEVHDEPLLSKYISKDRKHQFGFLPLLEKWFLMARGSIRNKFLESPVFYSKLTALTSQADFLNPLLISGDGWKRWVKDDTMGGIWVPVNNSITVKNCQPEIVGPESSQTSSVEISSTTATPMSFFESSTSSSELLPAWDQWDKWNDCSLSCGNGTRSRSRQCIGGADNSCIGKATDHQSCEITCSVTDAQVTDETITQSTEFLHGSKQAVLNCEVFGNSVFMYSNGILWGCRELGQGWHFPPLTFDGNVDGEITEFWIGGRLNNGKWVNDLNEDINEPVIYNSVKSKMLPRLFQVGLQFSYTDDICLYWQEGNIRGDSCRRTKPVVCCQELRFEFDQGKITMDYSEFQLEIFKNISATQTNIYLYRISYTM